MLSRAIAPYVAVGILAALIGCFAFGWFKGYASAERKHAEQIAAEVARGLELDADRRAVAAERDDLARQLEEAGNAEPIIVEQCLAPSRLRRLNAITTPDG